MKLWEGRFSKAVDTLMEEFNNSLSFDKKLIEEDIEGSIAWAKALQRVGVVSEAECTQLCDGLNGIRESHRMGELEFAPLDEDIHTAVERLLIERVGEVGARLHTGRSRNDQIATDFRLYAKKTLGHVHSLLSGFQGVLLERAEKEEDVIVPGYTHLQQAQPVSLAHYWLSLLFCIERDKKRLRQAIEAADMMPLGAGALAGSGFAVDREALAADLGFSRVTENSMDAVATRDFALQGLMAIATLAINLSRYAEDLIIWSSKEFGFVELDDAWSTGSSMMPQKKNPDSLELIRGKCGRFVGNMTRLATTLKGIGLTYYKDLQEDKEPFFDSVEQIQLVVHVFTEVIRTLTVRRDSIAADLHPFLLATDIADYLVKKNVPFRDAHHIVGRIVGDCVKNDKSLSDLTVTDYQRYSKAFDDDVQLVFSWKTALEHRSVQGGTGPESVKRQIEQAREIVGS